MGKYTNEELLKVQSIELGIFKDFAKVCEENNLKYWGIGGTGIGAMRHKGFIPWDDDIDVAMPYEDMVKLNEIFERDYREKYTVLNCEKFGDYPSMNEHIILNGTKFVANDVKNLKYPQGIFLDIFPLFKSPVDTEIRMKHVKKAWIWGKILILRQVPFPIIPFSGLPGKLTHIATFCVSMVLKIIFTQKWLYRKNMKISLKYDYLEDFLYEFYSDPVYGHCFFPKDTPDKLITLPFEDTQMKFPSNIDEYLKDCYGDYMQLPPEEKRVGHSPLILEFPKEV